MKSVKFQFCYTVFAIMIAFFISNAESATINVTVANFSFTPANINANVGDTIKWIWSNGGHTTTCNGTNGTSRPTGAAPWNANINSGSPSFSYVLTVAGSYHYVCLPHAPDMAGDINVSLSSITQLSEIVKSFELSQNYPNPFNPTTNIKFSVLNSSVVTLKIYSSLGQEVATLVNEKLNSGTYRVDWNAADFTSGIYYYTIKSREFAETKKMLLIK